MKRKNTYLAVLIVLAGVIIVGSLGLFGYFSYKNMPSYFNPNKTEQAKRLYNKVMDVDFDRNYPKTPDEVIDYYLAMSRLMYSDMIVEESVFGEVVTQMRKLFGPELAEENTYESQLANILDAVSVLKEQGIHQTGYEQLPTMFNSLDANICYIRANQVFNNGEVFYWEYQLERVLPENNWKIIRFESTDENYNVIEGAGW